MSSNASGCQVNVAGMSQQWNSTFCFYNHVSFESVIKHWSRFLIRQSVPAFHYFWLSSQWLLRVHYILFYYTWSTLFLIWHGIGLFVHNITGRDTVSMYCVSETIHWQNIWSCWIYHWALPLPPLGLLPCIQDRLAYFSTRSVSLQAMEQWWNTRELCTLLWVIYHVWRE
jgi:hypothetical protein